MLRTFALVVAICAAAPAVSAQQAAPELDAPVRSPGVTLTLGGYLTPSPAGQMMLPPSLLERIAGEDALLSVDTAPVDARVVVQVRFGFPDMASFLRWYADERTVQLIRDIRARVVGPTFETYIMYRPTSNPSAAQ
jgi:hypothetical protein